MLPNTQGIEIENPAAIDAGPSSAVACWTARWPGVLLLWAGWVLPQFLLLGPALIGQAVYSPVDLLGTPSAYLPQTPEYLQVVPNNPVLWDQVLIGPQFRDFAAMEIRAGRLPLWRPANYAGAPFATWPKYSPFVLPFYLAPEPLTAAWLQVVHAVCTGLGLWLFIRRALGLSYWPAAMASWCAPLTGFMSLWGGYGMAATVSLLAWSLLAVSLAVRRPWGGSTLAVAIVTAVILLTGQSDVGGLVLLTTGLYTLWLLMHRLRGRSRKAADESHSRSDVAVPSSFPLAPGEGPRMGEEPSLDVPRRAVHRAPLTTRFREVLSATAGIVLAWLLGFALAAPYLIPVVEYSRTSARIHARAAGFEERPPTGVEAIPAVVLPDIYGSQRTGSMRIVAGNQLESSSGAYAGLLAALWLAPLAWCHPTHRRNAIFFTLLAMVGVCWALNVPGAVHLLRLRPLNLLSYNRWVFATSTALLILSAIGLERLLTRPIPFRRWMLLPLLAIVGLGLSCLVLTVIPPEPLRTQLVALARAGRMGNLTPEGAAAIQHNFTICYAAGAGLSLAALAAWGATLATAGWAGWCRLACVALLPVELFWFATHERRLADRALYFPRIAALEKLAELPPGRIWGVRCFPPNLNASHKLEDIRGYDAVDPSHFVRLFELACDPADRSPPYAVTQFAVPKLVTPEGFKLHPVADLLNVRYFILRNRPPQDFPLRVQHDDYWIVENPNALPRAFVPRSVRVVLNDDEALAVLGRDDFDPRVVAVTSEVFPVAEAAEGEIAIHYDSPGSARLEAQMQTDGLVVVSDLWDAGWQATLDGAPCPIYRVDVALRGLRVPRGTHSIVMTYAPRSVRLGFQIAGAAAAVVAVWAAGLWLFRHRR